MAAQDDSAVHHRIANRLENLGITNWGLWARGGRDVKDVLEERADATVVDLGGFETAAEPKAAALAILDHLWDQRATRVGRLIVIDEAHNLCSPDPVSAIDRLLTERIVQVAAEGRKYGLWLLLSTQRPSKVHPDALSQCDNLGLMKMSSPRDLAELGLAFDGIGLHRVGLDVLSINSRAIAIYENIGFRHEGRLRDAYRDEPFVVVGETSPSTKARLTIRSSSEW